MKVFYFNMRSDVGKGLPLAGTYKSGENLFSFLRIIPVMLLVSGGGDLLKPDILDACYSQVNKSEGKGETTSF